MIISPKPQDQALYRLWTTCSATLFILIGLLVTGCKCTQPTWSPKQKQARREIESIQSILASIDVRAATNTAQTIIVDIHTHTFNARYLPLRGILLGKRDAAFPWTSLITDNCAINIAQQIVNCTELAPASGQDGISPQRDTAQVRANGHPGIICKIFLGIIDDAIRAGAWSPDKTLTEQIQAVDTMANNMSPVQKLAVKTAARMMGMEDHMRDCKRDDNTLTGIQAFTRFLWMLTQSDQRLPELYRAMHADVPVKGQITLISHTMDLAPVYDQPPDGSALLDFTKQIDRAETYASAPHSGMYYFVAYNPYRDFWPATNQGAALNFVKDAVLNHGAKGVKIYPPSGYRPAGNQIKRRPCTISRYPGKQWDARYGHLGPHGNEVLDDELNKLLEWCLAKDLPVLVHSGYSEFEARKGYGKHHSNPEFWEQFLKRHSSENNPCKLRLCLGHAGGEDFWFGEGKYEDWGQRVYRLCTNYPNVYCEVTTSEKMLGPVSQGYFVHHLLQLFKQSPAGDNHFAKKLIYGTDWPLPDQGKPAAVLMATQRTFLHPGLEPHYGDYFSGNAQRFLNFDVTERQ